jgi:hypothetical protein
MDSHPWIALVTDDAVLYTTRDHYEWLDHVACVGCDHEAISVNGTIEKVSCPRCLAARQDVAA